jgi:GNAT superfamily N-acetyltransferase
MPPTTTRELAARLPDVPRLVETRAMLLSGVSEVIGDTARGHYVVRSLDAALAALVGRPRAAALRDAVAGGRTLDILCAEDAVRHALASLPGWRAHPAIVHALPPHAVLPALPAAVDVRLVAGADSVPLAHVPSPLREEFEAARRRAPIVVGFTEGHAASFAYVPWQTETLCDLSIDTLEAYRRRGLAAATASRLIERVRASGKEPVWGALEDNAASLALAKRLGFVPVDRLFVLSRRRH